MRQMMTMSLDTLEELAKQDGMEFLDLSKSGCLEYVRQHLDEDTSHYNAFMRGCHDYLTGEPGPCCTDVDLEKLFLIRGTPDDWRLNRTYGYNYAKYVSKEVR